MADSLVVKIGADLGGLDKGLRAATQSVSTFGDTLKGAFLGGFAADLASSAFGAVKDSIMGAVHALAEVDKIAGQTAAVIRSTGGAAGITAQQVSSLADAIERKTGIEAESIQKGENLLLTFTNIKNAAGAGNDVFNQATKIMADLATAMGGDASGSAIQLGKALNDPTAGITALTRVGVTFTDAQKDQIKALQDSGNIMGAQKIILAELTKEFGGSADAAGKTFAGALDRAKNAVDSIAEAMIGPAVPVFTKALIEVSKAAYAISDAITEGRIVQLFDQAFGPGPRALIVGLATVLAARLVPNLMTVAMTADAMMTRYTRAISAMVVANAPLVAAVAAISFAAYPFIKNWDTVSGLFKWAWQSMLNAVTSAMNNIVLASRNMFEYLSGHFRAGYANAVSFFIGPLTRAFNALFSSLPKGVQDALGAFRISLPTVDLSGVGRAFETMKQSAMVIASDVSGYAGIAANNFMQTWGGATQAASNAMGLFKRIVADSSADAVRSVAQIGAAGTDMGEKVKAGHDKAADATRTHQKTVRAFTSEMGGAAKAVLEFVLNSAQLKRSLESQILWERINKQTGEYVEQNKRLNKVFDDAIDRVAGIDRVTKYWGDTTDRVAEKQKIFKDAIDELVRLGVDQASPMMTSLRQKYDELSASAASAATSTAEVKAKTDEFAAATSSAQSILGGFSSVAGAFGGADSPMTGVISTLQNGIRATEGMRDIQMGLAKQFGDTAMQTAIASKSLGSLALDAGLASLVFKGLELWGKAVYDMLGGWPGVFDVVTLGFQAMGWTLAFVAENVIGGAINAIAWSWTGLQNVVIDSVNAILMGVNATIGGLNKLGANLKEVGYLTRAMQSEVKIDFTSGIVSAMGETFQRLTGRMLATGAKGGQAKIDETSQMASKAMERLAESLAEADRKAKVWGATVETASAKQSAYKTAIDDLLRAGIEPTSESIQALKKKFDELETMASRGGVDQNYAGMIEGANALMQRAIDTGDDALRARAAEAFREAQAGMYGGRNEITINVIGSGRYSAEDARQIGQLIVGELKAYGVT